MSTRIVLRVGREHDCAGEDGTSAPAALSRVAGLTLLERAVRTVRRLGEFPITVAIDEAVPLPHRQQIERLVRERELGVQLEIGRDPGHLNGGLVIPSNWVFDQTALRHLLRREAVPLNRVGRDEPLLVLVREAADARRAERLLYQYRSGKKSDGFHTHLMKGYLSRLLTWVFLRTPVSPNLISLLGLLISAAAFLFFARGDYWSSLGGAALFYLASALDYTDGAVARLKFEESDFGCWLESFCDYSSYALVFAGLTWGLYRTSGSASYLWVGAALGVGAFLTFLFASLRRRRLARAERSEIHHHMVMALAQQRGHPLAEAVRSCSFLTRRSAVAHYLSLMVILGLNWVFLWVAAVGVNLAWMAILWTGRRMEGR